MKTRFPCRGPCAAALLFACLPALATRPMVVDDAGIEAPGNCQLESWTQRSAGQTEYWSVPACNFGGVLHAWELSAGLGRIGPDGPGGAYRAGVLQAKTVFHPLQTNGWGIGLTLANQFRQGAGVAGDLSVLVPASLSRFDDRLLLHANLGWLRAHTDHRSDLFWAGGAEWAARPRLALTLEAYGTARGHAMAQAGVRVTLVPDRVALDAGIGRRIGAGAAERYATIGLTVAGPMLR
jgi:hypothetical protein